MQKSGEFAIGDHVQVSDWSPQLELFSPAENPPSRPYFQDDDDTNEERTTVIVLDMSKKGMDLWRNPLTRDDIGAFNAEIIAIDANGHCTVRTSHVFREMMADYLFRRWEDAEKKAPCPRTEDYTQSYILSPWKLTPLGPWTFESRCEFLYGWRPTSAPKPRDLQKYCEHTSHGRARVNVAKRIMINHWGTVCEVDVCEEHAVDDGCFTETWSWDRPLQVKTV